MLLRSDRLLNYLFLSFIIGVLLFFFSSVLVDFCSIAAFDKFSLSIEILDSAQGSR